MMPLVRMIDPEGLIRLAACFAAAIEPQNRVSKNRRALSKSRTAKFSQVQRLASRYNEVVKFAEGRKKFPHGRFLRDVEYMPFRTRWKLG